MNAAPAPAPPVREVAGIWTARTPLPPVPVPGAAVSNWLPVNVVDQIFDDWIGLCAPICLIQ